MRFNNNEKEVIIQFIKENINNEKLKSVDIPYSLDLINRMDEDLNDEDLNLIEFCIEESYNDILKQPYDNISKQQFSNDYLEILDKIRHKFFVRRNS